jgi:hypothetical protein
VLASIIKTAMFCRVSFWLMTVLAQIMIFSPWQREREGEGILEAGKSNRGNMVYFRENAAEMGDREQSTFICKGLSDIEKFNPILHTAWLNNHARTLKI